MTAAPGEPAALKIHHVHARSDQDALEIRFPRVERYVRRTSTNVAVTWHRVPVRQLGPQRIPDETHSKISAIEDGSLLPLPGPGVAGKESIAPALSPRGIGGAEIPRYGRRSPGSTRDVNFWTSHEVREAVRSHVNYIVLDTGPWEHSDAYHLERDPHVVAFAQNWEHGLAIPYLHGGQTCHYLPDFLVRLHRDGREVGTLILEGKCHDGLRGVKTAAARRLVAAVNAEGSYGRWAYRMVTAASFVPASLESAARELAAPARVDWHVALERFVEATRLEYGPRLRHIVLYGSRARGDAEEDADLDLLVVLDRIADVRREYDRVAAIASRVTRSHDHLVSALPVAIAEFVTSRRPVLIAARREGLIVG